VLCSVAAKLVVCTHLSTSDIKCIAARADKFNLLLSFSYDVVRHIRCAAKTTSENSRTTATAIIVKASERRHVMTGVVVGGRIGALLYSMTVSSMQNVGNVHSLYIYTSNVA